MTNKEGLWHNFPNLAHRQRGGGREIYDTFMAPHVPIKTVRHRFIKSSILSPCASVSSSNSTENNSLAAASRHHRFLWTCSEASFPSLSDLEPNYRFADGANHAHCNIRPLLNAQKTHTHTLRLGTRFLWPLFVYGA